MPSKPTAKAISNLRELIAWAIAREKSYNVPGVCRRYGLADGSGDEAFSGKYRYAISRLKEVDENKVLEIARQLQGDAPDYALGEALAKIDEGKPSVTELTRRRIVAFLDRRLMTGKLPPMEFLERVWPLKELPSPSGSFEANLHDHLMQHWARNDDLSNPEALELLGVYTCSQGLFFRFLETLTDPLTWEPADQKVLVLALNEILGLDGLVLSEVERISGSPRYQVRHLKAGSSPADPGISQVLASFNATDIHERWEEALKRRSADPRAAITLARTLLEDTCKWILHSAGEPFDDAEDLPVLYRKLAKLLKLAPDDHTEQVFKRILGSCQSIVESLGAIRNKLGDAHSQGPVRARPQTRHAELAVNLAGTMATFLVATWEARNRTEKAKSD